MKNAISKAQYYFQTVPTILGLDNEEMIKRQNEKIKIIALEISRINRKLKLYKKKKVASEVVVSRKVALEYFQDGMAYIKLIRQMFEVQKYE